MKIPRKPILGPDLWFVTFDRETPWPFHKVLGLIMFCLESRKLRWIIYLLAKGISNNIKVFKKNISTFEN